MKRFLAGILACLMLAGGESMANDTSWDKTFPKSERVTVQKVTFKNRYGITLTGDLYLPRETSGKLPAIAVSGPFGAVKEQASGLYAQTLAEHGFIALAFDPSFTGESGGEPRSVASPDINTEDFSAAVDFLENSDLVIPEAVGILGICGFGGFALNAAAMDTRIKGTVTSTMYDMTRVTARGYNDSMNADARHEMKKELNSQRTRDYKNGSFALNDEHADSGVQQRNQKPGHDYPRRKGSQPLFQRGRLQKTHRRQQGASHCEGCQPHGSL